MDELITEENYELMIKLMRAFKTRGYQVASEMPKREFAAKNNRYGGSYDHPLPSFLRIEYTKDGMEFQYESQQQKRVVPLEYLLNPNWKKEREERENEWNEGRHGGSAKKKHGE